MQDSFASWMIAGGPHANEHDQRISHLVAIREQRQMAQADQPGMVERIRARVIGRTPAQTSSVSLDCCGA